MVGGGLRESVLLREEEQMGLEGPRKGRQCRVS